MGEIHCVALRREREGALPQPPAAPPQATPDAAGRTVYQRRGVREPDRPAGMGAPDPNRRVMVSGDRQISYDVRD